MSNQDNQPQSKIPAAPPRRQQTPPGQNLTEVEREQKQREIINSAPLRSSQADATNPAVTQSEPVADDIKPWRVGMGHLPVEALMQIRKKTSINQATEHELRLAFLVNDRNSKRGFGPKVYVNDLINEAIEQYTKSELKKLGYDTK